jgi:hypothetical protein
MMRKQLLNNGEDVHCFCESGHNVTLCRLTTNQLETDSVDEISHECLTGRIKVQCPKCPRADGIFLQLDLNKITYDDIPLPTGNVSQMVNQNARRANGTSKEWFCQ